MTQMSEWNFCSICCKPVPSTKREDGRHICNPCFSKLSNKMPVQSNQKSNTCYECGELVGDCNCRPDRGVDCCSECGLDYEDCECDNEYY